MVRIPFGDSEWSLCGFDPPEPSELPLPGAHGSPVADGCVSRQSPAGPSMDNNGEPAAFGTRQEGCAT